VAGETKNGRKPACCAFAWLQRSKAGRQACNYHPFYISMLYLLFFLFATSGPEHQQLVLKL
jgi:hypothetical protein